MPRRVKTRENPWDYAPWLKRAVEDFCKGTSASTPAQAVSKGERTLEQWCEFLARRREGVSAPQAVELTKESR